MVNKILKNLGTILLGAALSYVPISPVHAKEVKPTFNISNGRLVHYRIYEKSEVEIFYIKDIHHLIDEEDKKIAEIGKNVQADSFLLLESLIKNYNFKFLGMEGSTDEQGLMDKAGKTQECKILRDMYKKYTQEKGMPKEDMLDLETLFNGRIYRFSRSAPINIECIYNDKIYTKLVDDPKVYEEYGKIHEKQGVAGIPFSFELERVSKALFNLLETMEKKDETKSILFYGGGHDETIRYLLKTLKITHYIFEPKSYVPPNQILPRK